MKLIKLHLFVKSHTQLIAISLSTIGIDVGTFHFLYRQVDTLAFAHMLSFLCAAITSYLSITLWPLSNVDSKLKLNHFGLRHLLTFTTITLLVIFLRGGLLVSLMQIMALSASASILICAIFSSLLFFWAYLYFIYLHFNSCSSSEMGWDYFFIGIVVYTALLRLFYLGIPELLYEEAYYWNYAQHLDIGYLDHPLMIAWIIKLFISLMGNIEFAVRSGAFLCWFITAYFIYKLTREAISKASANWALLLVTTLPAFFSFSYFMTPDAPLSACWAMAIYYIHQAVIREDKRAWLGVGIAIGLGMVSKYTIVLLGAAILLFVFADKRSRKWLAKPQPYIAIAIACLLFTPVIIWNIQHEWASILFQSEGRISSDYSFSLPRFINNVIILLTPTGLMSVIAIILFRKNLFSSANPGSSDLQGTSTRSYLLLLWLTLFPVIIFAVLSLFRASKLNWTGPCWLGLIPFIALLITKKPDSGAPILLTWSQRAWPLTMVILLLIYGAGFHYLGLGLPMIPYPKSSHYIGQKNLGRDIEVVVTKLERQTGEKILVVGMGKNRIASGLAFYRTKYLDSSTEKAIHDDPAMQTASGHLFGVNGLMYELWFPVEKQYNKTMLLVSDDIKDLTGAEVLSRVQTAGDIKDIKTWKYGKQTGQYYYRLVTGYHSKPITIDPNASAPID